MTKRNLRIVRRSPPLVIGVCERCNAQFKSERPEPAGDLEAQFNLHKCHPIDSSQNALRIVREATENK
jgi:hypothetical protein